MELDIAEADMSKLKACVLFHGEKGAMVTIVDQDQYKDKKYENEV